MSDDPDPILLVDDEPTVLLIAGRYLREAGYRVQTAGSGPEALELLRTSGPVRVLVTDLRRPEMNGAELADRVRELHPETVVVFIAGYPSIRTPLPGPVIVKPFADGQLIAQVRAALGKK